MKTDNKIVVVGKLGRVYGVKGWIKLHSFTDPPDNILDYKPWLIYHQGKWEQADLQEIKAHGNKLLAKFFNIDTPEQAQIYTNANIGISRDQLPALINEEHYWSDLEGLRVITEQGVELGIVDHLLATGANDVLVVKGTKEYLLPYIKQVIRQVDLEQGIIVVDWGTDY